jgi:hypothetical protein
MLKLIVENTEADNPTTRLRWCTNAQTLSDLQGRGVFDPSILLVVYNVESRREYRYIAKLSDLMMFVPFRNPGENRIFATICWDTKEKSVADRYLRMSDNSYDTNMVRGDGTGFLDKLVCTFDFATATVHVDAKLFPEHPRDWRWVNKWFNVAPVDQCAFRKRRFLAYSIQPIAFAFWFVVATVIMMLLAFVTLIIGKVPRWEMLYAFHDDTINRPEEMLKHQPVYFTDQWYFQPFRPVFLIIAIVLGLAGGMFFNATYLFTVLLFTGKCFAALAVLYFVLRGGIEFICWYKHRNWESSAAAKRLRKQADEAAARAKQRRLEEEAFEKAQRALCSYVKDDDPMAIPDKAMTARLRFNGVKREVCRPYAQ